MTTRRELTQEDFNALITRQPSIQPMAEYWLQRGWWRLKENKQVNKYPGGKGETSVTTETGNNLYARMVLDSPPNESILRGEMR